MTYHFIGNEQNTFSSFVCPSPVDTSPLTASSTLLSAEWPFDDFPDISNLRNDDASACISHSKLHEDPKKCVEPKGVQKEPHTNAADATAVCAEPPMATNVTHKSSIVHPNSSEVALPSSSVPQDTEISSETTAPDVSNLYADFMKLFPVQNLDEVDSTSLSESDISQQIQVAGQVLPCTQPQQEEHASQRPIGGPSAQEEQHPTGPPVEPWPVVANTQHPYSYLHDHVLQQQQWMPYPVPPFQQPNYMPVQLQPVTASVVPSLMHGPAFSCPPTSMVPSSYYYAATPSIVPSVPHPMMHHPAVPNGIQVHPPAQPIVTPQVPSDTSAGRNLTHYSVLQPSITPTVHQQSGISVVPTMQQEEEEHFHTVTATSIPSTSSRKRKRNHSSETETNNRATKRTRHSPHEQHSIAPITEPLQHHGSPEDVRMRNAALSVQVLRCLLLGRQVYLQGHPEHLAEICYVGLHRDANKLLDGVNRPLTLSEYDRLLQSVPVDTLNNYFIEVRFRFQDSILENGSQLQVAIRRFMGSTCSTGNGFRKLFVKLGSHDVELYKILTDSVLRGEAVFTASVQYHERTIVWKPNSNNKKKRQ